MATNVWMVSPEMAPFSKVGGLGDVLGVLPQALAAHGCAVTVVIPHLATMDAGSLGITATGVRVTVTVDGERRTAQILEARPAPGVRVLLVVYPPYFHRAGLYGTPAGDYADNAQRFAFLSYAALEAAKRLAPGPAVVHTHDWQTGLVPFLLRSPAHYGADGQFLRTLTVHTIHNLSYQGLFPADLLPGLGIGWEHFTFRELEFYGLLNFLKAGLVSADLLTTVSPTYAREIQTPDFAWGLHGVLVERADRLHGILNGIDTALWDPVRDAQLTATFGVHSLRRRAANTTALRRSFGLPEDGRPLVGIVNRLVAQKGIDLVTGLAERVEALGLQWVILGSGEAQYEAAVDELRRAHPRTVAAHIGFDDGLARRIYGGSDFFCMPSFFEPCGLGQMIALRYGSLPIVRRTGGLADTVPDVEARKAGVGIVFDPPTVAGLGAALERAAALARQPRRLLLARRRAMAMDFSWGASAKRYLELYRSPRPGARG